MSSQADGRAVRGAGDAGCGSRTQRGKPWSSAAMPGRHATHVAEAGVPLSRSSTTTSATSAACSSTCSSGRTASSCFSRQTELYGHAPAPWPRNGIIARRFLDRGHSPSGVRPRPLGAVGRRPLAERGARRPTGVRPHASWRDLPDVGVQALGREPRPSRLPLRPRALATLVANVFQGIEVELLAGVNEATSPHRGVLDALGALIARAETTQGLNRKRNRDDIGGGGIVHADYERKHSSAGSPPSPLRSLCVLASLAHCAATVGDEARRGLGCSGFGTTWAQSYNAQATLGRQPG